MGPFENQQARSSPSSATSIGVTVDTWLTLSEPLRFGDGDTRSRLQRGGLPQVKPITPETFYTHLPSEACCLAPQVGGQCLQLPPTPGSWARESLRTPGGGSRSAPALPAPREALSALYGLRPPSRGPSGRGHDAGAAQGPPVKGELEWGGSGWEEPGNRGGTRREAWGEAGLQ